MIHKTRREWFGGVVYSENPGFTAFVDSRHADSLGIPSSCDLPDGFFSAPLDVHMAITGRCNLRCRGCYVRQDDSAPTDMPLNLAQAIIDRLAEMNVLTIALGGGEPLLHPEWPAIAHYARMRGIVPNVTTNGLLMDASIAERCRIFGCIHVSCHHPSELSRLTETVRFLRNARIETGLNVLVTAVTLEELPRIWSWCKRQGIKQILLLKFKLTENNRACRDMALSPTQEQSLLPLIRRLSRRYSIMPMLDCSFFPALAHHAPRKKDLEFFDVNGCVGGNAVLAITRDGQFKPCSFCRTSYGDALSLNRDVWAQNEALAKFRRTRPSGGCALCAYEELCNGGCRISETDWCQRCAG